MDVNPAIIARLLLTSFLVVLGCGCNASRGQEVAPTKRLETVSVTSTPKETLPIPTVFTLTPSPMPSLTSTASPKPTKLPTSTPTPVIIAADKLNSLTVIHALKHPESVTEVAFSPDGSILATGSVDGIVRLWQVNIGALLFALEGHSDIVQGLAFSPDRRVLATGSDDMTLRLWLLVDGSLIRIIDTSIVGKALKVEYSPDGSLIAIGGNLCYIMLRNTNTGLLRRILRQPLCLVKNRGPVIFWGLAFSLEDSSLISAEGQPRGNGGSVQRWDYEHYTPPQMLRGYDIVIRDMSLSPDGSRLALAQVGNSEIWELDSTSGSLIKKYKGHTFRVNAVAYSPDGRLLASAGRDEVLRLWDVTTGDLLHILEGHSAAVNSLAFSPDGGHLASASEDGTVIIWGLPSP